MLGSYAVVKVDVAHSATLLLTYNDAAADHGIDSITPSNKGLHIHDTIYI